MFHVSLWLMACLEASLRGATPPGTAGRWQVGFVGAFQKWGIPNSWMLYFMNNPTKMDDLGVPHGASILGHLPMVIMICRHSCTWYAITFKVFGKLGTSLVYFQRKRPIFATCFLRLETLIVVGVPEEHVFCGTIHSVLEMPNKHNYKLDYQKLVEGRHVITVGSYT